MAMYYFRLSRLDSNSKRIVPRSRSCIKLKKSDQRNVTSIDINLDCAINKSDNTVKSKDSFTTAFYAFLLESAS